jgi:zinc/manganese transport system substrate-binding protein
MGLDAWGATVVESSGNVKIQRGTAGWITAAAGCWKGELPKEISRAWGDVHPDGNPHVWLDPANAVAMARTIAEALAKADAAHAAEYAGRADDFESRVVKAWIGEACAAEIKPDHLRRLASRGKLLEFIEGSETLKGKLGGWARKAAPLKGIKVVSYHKTYFYLARQFGFEIVAELEEFPGKDPPPKHKAEVVKIVKEKGAKLILSDVFYPRDAADFVAGQTGAKVVVTHIEIGSQEGTADYFGLIDRMLDALTGALK